MPLILLRQAIITAWEALTPPAPDPHRLYRYVEKPGTGASSHRQFYFRNPRGSAIMEQGAARYGIDHFFEAVIQLQVPERTSREFDAPYREYQTLMPAVSRVNALRNIAPRVVEWRTEFGIGDTDVDLILVIGTRTKEAA